MKRLFLLLALCGMFTVGCTEGGENEIQDDAYITLNKEVLTFVPDGESVEVKVYSNYEWTLTNNCDWVTASISGGEASEEGTAITLTADLTYDDREGTIIFSCGKAKKVLVVSQGLKEVIIADENNTFNLPVEGGTVDIAYQTSVECEVIIPEEAKSWISLAPETRGLESGCATLNIAENNTGAELSTVVKVVKMGDQSVFAEYSITQERNMDYIILYTTTNGETISPNNFDYLTNTYEDGVGMLAFDGSKVTSIGNGAFDYCDSLTSVTIPDSVTSIGDRAFYDCKSLTSVTIPDSVTSIGNWAFVYCSSLTSVTIGNSVTSIGDYAFSGCDSLTSVHITDIAAWCNISFGNYSSNPLYYAGNLYLNNELVTDLIIPDSVTSIGDEAFRECTSLTSVTIGNSVTSIGGWAFEGCTSLTSVTIGNGVTSIGGGAFYDCDSLTSVTIGNGVTSIGSSAFYKCTSLTSVTIGNGVTSIGNDAFYYCDSLKSVYITDIAVWCNISFGNDLSNPLYYAGNLYLNNELVTDLIIPDSVTSIGSYAFSGCDSLTSVTIPDSVTSIGDYAFKGCTSLKEVYCKPTTPPRGGSWMFDDNASGRTIYVPRNSVSAYKSASGWSDYKNYIVGYDF